MSASTIPTDRPESAIATAMLAVTVDLPTPPLPLLMAIMRGAAWVSGCAISISLARGLEGRYIARTELFDILRRQFRRHAGTIGRPPGRPEVTAVPAGAERRNLAPHCQRGGQSGQGHQEPRALRRSKPVDHPDQVAQRILSKHPVPLVG